MGLTGRVNVKRWKREQSQVSSLSNWMFTEMGWSRSPNCRSYKFLGTKQPYGWGWRRDIHKEWEIPEIGKSQSGKWWKEVFQGEGITNFWFLSEMYFLIWLVLFYFIFLNFILFLNFTILYWFCQISKWIHHRYTRVPHPEPSSLLLPHTIPLGRPSAPAPSIQYRASNLDWRLVSYMIVYMFQCHSPKSSHPLPLPQSP